MKKFDYLLRRIQAEPFQKAPFSHLHLQNLFTSEDFQDMTRTHEIDIPAARSDTELFELLSDAGYEIIEFPGCITHREQYISWRSQRSRDTTMFSTCEGFGITLRLISPRSSILIELQDFMRSDEFADCLADKFQISLADVRMDAGIQKYLDGYEISPHPDIRKKALTYMVNINPHAHSEEATHHTQYLTLKDEYQYVERFWTANPDLERCWVPWSWCETQYVQNKNNSMVIFGPSNDTLHGIKASYDHLPAQRTQLYGNFWYTQQTPRRKVEWEELETLREGFVPT